jgi:hypothetical protein
MRFKESSHLHNVKVRGEASGADVETNCSEDLRSLMKVAILNNGFSV